MKKRNYNIALIIVLILLLILNIYFLVDTGYFAFHAENFEPSDVIISFICLVLSSLVVFMELFNTFKNFNGESNFIKRLIYDEDESTNTKFLVISNIVALLFIALTIYQFLVTFTSLDIAKFNFIKPMNEVIFSFSTLFVVDFIFIDIFYFLKIR